MTVKDLLDRAAKRTPWNIVGNAGFGGSVGMLGAAGGSLTLKWQPEPYQYEFRWYCSDSFDRAQPADRRQLLSGGLPFEVQPSVSDAGDHVGSDIDRPAGAICIDWRFGQRRRWRLRKRVVPGHERLDRREPDYGGTLLAGISARIVGVQGDRVHCAGRAGSESAGGCTRDDHQPPGILRPAAETTGVTGRQTRAAGSSCGSRSWQSQLKQPRRPVRSAACLFHATRPGLP